jgi:hypothetical protein
MKTTDIFKPADSRKINETLEKTFGQKLNLESYTLEQLEDARNRLRTQVHQYKQSSSFNETVENDAYTKAQWMLDAINAEISERGEHIVGGEEIQETEETTKEEDMTTRVQESATDKASAVVTAKTMVDRVGRWIEELAGMENDQLLELGDTIRDEMGQQQAKAFLGAVAPAIQSALETLKQTRETLSSGVRGLTGEEQPEEMLGAETPDMGADDMAGAADTDAMNPELGDETDADADAAALDDFAAAEPAAGGPDEAGRAKRESINRSNSLLKVLAG